MSTAPAIDISSLPSLDLKNIVVAVSLKEECGFTALYALRLAEIFQSRLHVVYVHDPQPLTEIAGSEAMDILERQERLAEERLELLVGELQQSHPDCHGKFLMGDPAEEVTRFAKACHADLIVTASHQVGFLARVFGLDCAPRIVHQTRCPVLVIAGR